MHATYNITIKYRLLMNLINCSMSGLCDLDRNKAEIPGVAGKFFNVTSVEVF